MAWKFRFPAAILHYIKDGGTEERLNVIEKARDWAISSGNTRTKKPTFKETELWISEILEEDKRTRETQEVEHVRN